jgi:hypothetical protein
VEDCLSVSPELRCVDVSAGVVEEVPRLRIDSLTAPISSEAKGCSLPDDPHQEVDTCLVIHARVEEQVVQHQLVERWHTEILNDAAKRPQ